MADHNTKRVAPHQNSDIYVSLYAHTHMYLHIQIDKQTVCNTFYLCMHHYKHFIWMEPNILTQPSKSPATPSQMEYYHQRFITIIFIIMQQSNSNTFLFKCNNNNSKLNIWNERAVNEILYVDRISIFHFNSMAVAADSGGYFSFNFCHNMQLNGG